VADRSPIRRRRRASDLCTGVDVTDDWDGIGQRLTGSGSTRFHDVEILPRDILPEREFTDESRSYSATFPQLYLTTVIAGILRAITAEAVELVRGRRRNYYHGSADEPRREPAVQSTVGQISVNSHAADAIVEAAAWTISPPAPAGYSSKRAGRPRSAVDSIWIGTGATRELWLHTIPTVTSCGISATIYSTA
jgi:alkylation response protein AidB-like acyl-CoA dehydrogenase